MPSQTTKSPVADALKRGGLGKLFDKHKGDETRLAGGAKLPAGIEGGVMQLTEAEIRVYDKGKANEGKPYLYLRAVVVEPKQYAGYQSGNFDFSPGQSTNLFGDTEEKKEERVASVLNTMRLLGIQTQGLELDDWEAALAALKEEAPHFSFRTWAFDKEEIVQRGGKYFIDQNGKQKAGPFATEEALKKANKYAGSEPRVFHDWRGLATTYVASNSNGSAVHDNTGDSPSENGEASSSDATGEEVDYLALGTQADEGDVEASTTILTKAEELGIKESVEGAKNWADGAQLVVDALGGSSRGDTSAPFEPKKGNIYSLKSRDAKGVMGKKFEDFECTAVYSSTVNLKRLSDSKVFTKVEWTADPPQIWKQDVEA